MNVSVGVFVSWRACHASSNQKMPSGWLDPAWEHRDLGCASLDGIRLQAKREQAAHVLRSISGRLNTNRIMVISVETSTPLRLSWQEVTPDVEAGSPQSEEVSWLCGRCGSFVVAAKGNTACLFRRCWAGLILNGKGIKKASFRRFDRSAKSKLALWMVSVSFRHVQLDAFMLTDVHF